MPRRAARKPLRAPGGGRSDRAAGSRAKSRPTLARQWDGIAAEVDREQAAVISGASGLEPATAEPSASVLEQIGLPCALPALISAMG